jgi:hypothetical protein
LTHLTVDVSFFVTCVNVRHHTTSNAKKLKKVRRFLQHRGPPRTLHKGLKITRHMQRSESNLSCADVVEDKEWAALASAAGAADEQGDEDCQLVQAAFEAAAADLKRLMSAHVMAAKSKLAQKGQARQAQVQAQADAQREL